MAESITNVKYKKGAYIIVEGEKSDFSFFIVQSGRVILNRTMIVSEISKMDYSEGDTFEVESALTGRPRLFTAVAASDCSIIRVPVKLFDVLMQKRPSLVQKIILEFSQRMRNLDHVLTRISLEKQEFTYSGQLVIMGKYYEKVDMLQPASFSYYHYLKSNPNGKLAKVAQENYDRLLPSLGEDITKTFEEDPVNHLQEYKANHMIFGEGMPGDRMYFIQEGSVKICKIANNSEITLAVLSKGDFFGEMALLENKPRSANAIADTDCTLLVITTENFPILIQRQPKLIVRITTVLAERIWFLYRQIANVILPPGPDRLFDAILIFMERQNKGELTNRNFEINMSAKELLKYTGMEPKLANDTLRTFVKDHVITINNTKNTIVVGNPQYIQNRVSHIRNTFQDQYKRSKET